MSQKLTVSQYQLLKDLSDNDYRFNITQKASKSLARLHQFNLVKKGPIALTEDGKKLVKDFYRFRHFSAKYNSQLLDLNYFSHGANFNYGKFVADFDLKPISNLINRFKQKKNNLVLDPFCGTGITNLACFKGGIDSIGIDANPLMIWQNKIKFNSNTGIDKVVKIYEKLITSFVKLDYRKKNKIWRKSNLNKFDVDNKWLNPITQKEIAVLYDLIGEIEKPELRSLFYFLCGQTASRVSNASFCPGICFYITKKNPVLMEFKKVVEMFIADLSEIKLSKNPKLSFWQGSVTEREMANKLSSKVNLVVTSPPYPNNLDYILTAKMELYLQGIVKNKGELTKIRQKMICSNAKMVTKKRQVLAEINQNDLINNISELIEIQLKNKNWGFNYQGMIKVYFSEMYLAMFNLHKILSRKGVVIMIVGDQTVKGVKIRTAEILGQLALQAGFKRFEIEIFRNRKASLHKKSINEKCLIIYK